VRLRDRRNPYVESDKDDKDPDVPPALRILDIEVVAEIFVRRPIATKLALGGRNRVREVSSVGGDVPFEVSGARLAGGWINITVLDVRTVDLLSAES